MPVKLGSIVPWGRSFDEYGRMFALSEEDLSRRILDCAAGPSSFSAEMFGPGQRVISCDPIYEFSAEQIRSRVAAVRDDMIEQVGGRWANLFGSTFDRRSIWRRCGWGRWRSFWRILNRTGTAS